MSKTKTKKPSKTKTKDKKDPKYNQPIYKSLVGRPTKYKRKYAEMLIDYFNVDLVITDEKTGKVEAVRFPTLERFACNIGVFVDTLANWANATVKDGDGHESPQHPEFLRAYRTAKSLQKDILVGNAIAGRYQSNFAQFVAVNYTDMADKKEIDATSGGERIGGFNFIIPEGADDKDDNSNIKSDS